MSRHRNIRKMNYNDECEGFDDVYGHSVDDDSSCISPTDSSQFLFDRDRQQNMSAFLASHRDIQEENENETEAEIHDKRRRDSENFQFPKLNDEDHAKLLSCIDEIRNVVGDFVSERQLVETIMQFNYDVTKALDVVLNTSITPPSQLKQQVPMEITPKDSNLLNLSSSNIIKYCENKNQEVKKLSLYDLAKSHNNSIENSGTNVKFVLPKLSNLEKCDNNIIKTETKSFLSLSDLANFHLKTNNTNESLNKFVLPKLSSSPVVVPVSLDNHLTPHQESLNKIMNLRKLNITDNKIDNFESLIKKEASAIKDNWIIDLTSALITDKEKHTPVKIPIKNENKLEDIFIPRFIDCDIEPYFDKQITQHCEIDLSSLINNNLLIKSVKCSKFGKIICRKFCVRSVPSYVKHEFKPKHIINFYNFNQPSPDDITLKFLEKAKRK